MMRQNEKILICSLTRQGSQLGERISKAFPGSSLAISSRLCKPGYSERSAIRFDSFNELCRNAFSKGQDLVCIMAAGIVVRSIAPYLKGKHLDPAVVVVDEAGQFVISLLSGHLGGANRLAKEVASRIGAVPIITTATDINDLPAFDVLAVELGLSIENLSAIRRVNMALIEGERIGIFDPDHILLPALEGYLLDNRIEIDEIDESRLERLAETSQCYPGVYVGRKADTPVLPCNWLILRPRDIVAGIGCNRGTEAKEILGLLNEVFTRENLSLLSLRAIASVEIKKDEKGLWEAAKTLGVQFIWYSPEELDQVEVPHPSQTVSRHIGTRSVCEAAALLATGAKTLIVSKTSTRNVTLALALDTYL